MLNREIEQKELFTVLQPLAANMGLCVVDVVKSVRPNNTDIAAVVCSENGETTIDTCEAFHRAALPLMEVMFGKDELSMSVSTPGLQRQFKDFYEFRVFKGRNVRLYSLKDNLWVSGTIADVSDDSVRLENVVFEDAGDEMPKSASEYIAGYREIQKAKLEFVFEKTEKEKAEKKEKKNGKPKKKDNGKTKNV